MIKQFGRKTRRAAPREKFDLTVLRGDEPETHRFQIVAVLDAGGLSSVMVTTRKDQEMALPATIQVIRKMLDNTDGTPSGWEPNMRSRRSILSQETPAEVVWPSNQGDLEAEPEEDPTLDETVFRAPFGLEKGQLLPASRVGEFLAPEAGSSRRRWDALLADDDISIEAPDLMAIFEWCVGTASQRPTGMSS